MLILTDDAKDRQESLQISRKLKDWINYAGYEHKFLNTNIDNEILSYTFLFIFLLYYSSLLSFIYYCTHFQGHHQVFHQLQLILLWLRRY